MGTFGDLLSKGIVGRMNFGLLFVFIIFILLTLFSYTSLVYLTKFGFKSKRSPDGQECVQLSTSKMTIIKVGLVIIWIYIIIDIIMALFTILKK